MAQKDVGNKIPIYKLKKTDEVMKYYDKDGWEISAPISDRECIYRCLENCINLAGLDKVQVMRLMEDFETMKTEFVRNEEYPVL